MRTMRWARGMAGLAVAAALALGGCAESMSGDHAMGDKGMAGDKAMGDKSMSGDKAMSGDKSMAPASQGGMMKKDGQMMDKK